MIFRCSHDKENPYLLVNRTGIKDSRLSFKAVGLLMYLLSKPDDWATTESDLIKSHKDGQTSIESAIKELRKYGYMKKVQVRSNGGRILKWETHVFETPQDDDFTKPVVITGSNDPDESEKDTNQNRKIADSSGHRSIDNRSIKPRSSEAKSGKPPHLLSNEYTEYRSLQSNEEKEYRDHRSRLAPHQSEDASVPPFSFHPLDEDPRNGSFIDFEELPVKNPGPGHSKFHEECARILRKAIEENGFVCGNKTKKTLCEGFRLLEKEDRRPKGDIEKLLNWYTENCHRKFCPKAYTSQQFREKWNQLWHAMKTDVYEREVEKELSREEQLREFSQMTGLDGRPCSESDPEIGSSKKPYQYTEEDLRAAGVI